MEIQANLQRRAFTSAHLVPNEGGISTATPVRPEPNLHSLPPIAAPEEATTDLLRIVG